MYYNVSMKPKSEVGKLLNKAETSLNCGHKRLDVAARDRAARHRFYISVGPGASKARWDSWK
jgi:hypothetical protein